MSITRRLFAICLGLSLLSLIVVFLEIRTTTASASRRAVLPAVDSLFSDSDSARLFSRSSGHLFQQPQPIEKTAGQARKNIQLLKDLPDAQLIPVMNFIAASLGVKCNFCHVLNNGQLEPASDDKPEKKTAREMIAMTLSVNKTSFDGRTEVSCYTCHHGISHPLSVPPLPL